MCRAAAVAVMKLEAGVEGDGAGEGVAGQLRQGFAVGRGAGADGAERDVNTSRSLDHGVEVLLHGSLVKSVNLCSLSDAASSNNVLGDSIHLRHVASRQEQPCPLACESPGDGAANRSPSRIDDGGLVFKQHFVLHSVHVGSDTGGGENGTAGPFRDEPVSLPVMTAAGQANARIPCGATC
jgi:hypothetical protein